MSLLAKVFIVVQALLVMTYLGVASALYQHKRDWRKSYQSMKQRYHDLARRGTKEISTLRETVGSRNSFIELKDVEINSLKKELTRADADYQSKNQALSRKTAEFDRLQQANNQLTTTNDTLNNTLRSRRQRLAELQQNLDENIKRRQIAEGQVARLKSLTINLEGDLGDLKTEYSTIRNDLRDKSLLIAMAEERGISFATLLGGPPAKLVRGRVAIVKVDMDPPLIVADVGSDDGVEIGYPLSVFRGNLFVGKVLVERVEGSVSACRIQFLADGESIQPGDSITTRLP